MRKFLLVLLICLAGPAVFAQQGTLRNADGTVEIKHPGQTAFVPAKAGDAVPAKAIVSTGFKSSAVIAVGNSLITVRPLTRLSLEEMIQSQNSETVNLQLQAGRVRVEVKPPAGTKTNLTVQTPSATASVRGTEFESDTFNTTVNEGVVEFHGQSGGIVLIGSGDTGRIDNQGRAQDPQETFESELRVKAPAGMGETGALNSGPAMPPSDIIVFNFVFD
ncbi:iron dicitrate transporter FecR [Spirochaetia bacterium]|nr:iron dicitrate transporter FecR [Spirochaetia bacterium]